MIISIDWQGTSKEYFTDMRPIYENEENISNEVEVAGQIAKAWAMETVKLKRLYPFDWGVVDSRTKQVVGFIEIKCRTNPSSQYPTYMISAEKVRWAIDTTITFAVRCFIAVKWTDMTGVHRVNPDSKYHLFMGGRDDRNDSQDIEPVCLIPIRLFDVL